MASHQKKLYQPKDTRFHEFADAWSRIDEQGDEKGLQYLLEQARTSRSEGRTPWQQQQHEWLDTLRNFVTARNSAAKMPFLWITLLLSLILTGFHAVIFPGRVASYWILPWSIIFLLGALMFLKNRSREKEVRSEMNYIALGLCLFAALLLVAGWLLKVEILISYSVYLIGATSLLSGMHFILVAARSL
jgi:hypothetical protein